MSRPPDLGGKKKRDRTLGVRLSREEYERLAQRAKEADRNVSGFVREVVLSVLKTR